MCIPQKLFSGIYWPGQIFNKAASALQMNMDVAPGAYVLGRQTGLPTKDTVFVC